MTRRESFSSDSPTRTGFFQRRRSLRKRSWDVNGVKLELAYHGQNHCEGNIFVFAPKQKVLAAIDIVAPGWGGVQGM